MTETEVKNVAAVERALAVLDTFRKGDAALSLTEISERAGLYKSTVLRLLQTLESFSYVARTEGGLYHIGSKPLRLAALYQEAIQPADLIMPILRVLVQKTNESASFSIHQDQVRVCVYRVDSPQPIRDHMRPGDVYPLGRGAAGVVLAAFANPDDPAYAQIREALIARTVAGVDPDTAGVAAPVFAAHDALAGALAVSGPRNRFDDAAMERFGRVVVTCAARLTEQLGGDPSIFEGVLRA